MLIGRRRVAVLARCGGLIILCLLVSTLVPITAAAVADPPMPPRAAPSATKGPQPAGVSPQPAASDTKGRPTKDQPKLKLRPRNPAETATVTDYNCMPFAYLGLSGIGQDEFLEETVGVSYYGGVDCNFSLDYIQGDVGVLDRSPSFNGQSFNGGWLADSGIYGWGYGASNSGGFGVQARYYNGARRVEPVLTLTLYAPYDLYWDYCGWVPGMYYYTCQGVGTNVLYMVLGAGEYGTGLTQACRDQSAPLDPEQAQLRTPSGSTPWSTQSLNSITSIRNRVVSFKRALCSTSAAGASAFATTQGQQLWDNAVAEAKNTATQNDDRPLYWARLSMTAALQQWRGVAVDRAALQQSLDRAARGMNSHSFTLGTAKKVVVSGFDPFQLDINIRMGNPSAAAVLGLDNTTLNGAEVQVVIFPVRYADFNARMVEDVFRPHLAAGSQQATLITTVSQGGSANFELEKWNGRRRAGNAEAPDTPLRDNRDALPTDGVPSLDGAGTYNSPLTPPVDQGAEFIVSTLPFQAMLIGPHVVLDNSVVEQLTPGISTPSASGPSLSQNPVAVHGSGGGYLSNEIAYRVTALRDSLGSPVQAGHIHTPVLNNPDDAGQRNDIVTKYREILRAAIGGTSSPVCGEASCTPVQAAYISHFTGPGCTGTESYYTPYFYYDGIRRSWDGQGVAGTILRTVTNRSAKTSDGVCHDSWPNGNTLNDFVTIYRAAPVCGEASCTPVQAAYISHFTGPGCTGTESYYTPYFYYDGIRRSWDGQGVAGTTLRTVTNRSAKTSDGVCHDSWPNGNTLSDFVTIYR